jgi:anion-transporting  ArsA/GET3 family ATPase
LSLERLRHTAAAGYDLAVIDAGPHDTLLRVAALPDSFRWLVRLLFGLDRGPGGNVASLNQALVPTSLLPAEWFAPVQDGRMQFEAIRDRAFAAGGTIVRYVVRPDVMGLNEARLAVPALQLHGLSVDSLVTGPLLPNDSSDTRLHTLIEQQQQISAEVARVWAPRPVLSLPLTTPPRQVDDLVALGQAIYGSRASNAAERMHDGPAPIVHGDRSDPSVTIHLPGITRETLSLTVSGDELIVRIGPYRRHILLPAALRNVPNIKASRDGERLIVRLRQ